QRNSRRSQLRTIAKAASAEMMISPATATVVMKIEIAKPRGKFVRFHASTKLEKVSGSGRLNALPSTACAVVFSDMFTVTNSGTSTVSEPRSSSTVAGQLTRSRPTLPRRRRRAGVEGVAGGTAAAEAAGVAVDMIRTPSFLG